MYKFHRLCGKNVSLDDNCTTAKRIHPTKTYGDCICFTNTPLVNDEMFELQVEELVTRWSGSLCLGMFCYQILQTNNNVILMTETKHYNQGKD